MLESLPASEGPVWILAAVLGLTALLRKANDARETWSRWVMSSDKFKEWESGLKGHVAKAVSEESETTRKLIRDMHVELMREIGHLKETHVPRTELEKLKGRTATLESLNAVHHGDPIPNTSDTTGIRA